MKAYICGPMRGYEHHNFPAFDEAKTRLIAAGYDVISPADLDRALGIHADITDDEFTEQNLRDCMKADMDAITECDTIALLPGWEESRGARPEIVLANTLGLIFINATDLRVIIPIAAAAVVGARLLGEAHSARTQRQFQNAGLDNN